MKVKALFYYIIIPVFLLVSLVLVTLSLNVGSKEGKIILNKKVLSPVFNNYTQDKLLLFFGYAGCMNVCTPKLEELSAIYRQLDTKEKNDVGVLFINLSILEDPQAADIFAKAFHHDFEGIYLKQELLKELQDEFHIYMAPSFANKGDYDHTAFLFLLKKTAQGYTLNSIYTDNVLSHNLILTDLKK